MKVSRGVKGSGSIWVLRGVGVIGGPEGLGCEALMF